ncbi:MAG: aldo/keto reductase, partial [Gemmatimonadaceae bacterium]|nr:aldo/keto reductase [Gemmatimonadaceae bacterium]
WARIAAHIDRAPGPRGEVYALERHKGGPHASIMRYNLNTS